jgi:hypothetical protein
MKSVAKAGAGVLVAVVLVTPSMEAMAVEAVDAITESAVKGLLHPFWPFEHGKCFTLDRFDPTCPRCL